MKVALKKDIAVHRALFTSNQYACKSSSRRGYLRSRSWSKKKTKKALERANLLSMRKVWHYPLVPPTARAQAQLGCFGKTEVLPLPPPLPPPPHTPAPTLPVLPGMCPQVPSGMVESACAAVQALYWERANSNNAPIESGVQVVNRIAKHG